MVKFPIDPAKKYTFTGSELKKLLYDYSVKVAADAANRVLQAYGDPQKMANAFLKATGRNN